MDSHFNVPHIPLVTINRCLNNQNNNKRIENKNKKSSTKTQTNSDQNQQTAGGNENKLNEHLAVTTTTTTTDLSQTSKISKSTLGDRRLIQQQSNTMNKTVSLLPNKVLPKLCPSCSQVLIQYLAPIENYIKHVVNLADESSRGSYLNNSPSVVSQYLSPSLEFYTNSEEMNKLPKNVSDSKFTSNHSTTNTKTNTIQINQNNTNLLSQISNDVSPHLQMQSLDDTFEEKHSTGYYHQGEHNSLQMSNRFQTGISSDYHLANNNKEHTQCEHNTIVINSSNLNGVKFQTNQSNTDKNSQIFYSEHINPKHVINNFIELEQNQMKQINSVNMRQTATAENDDDISYTINNNKNNNIESSNDALNKSLIENQAESNLNKINEDFNNTVNNVQQIEYLNHFYLEEEIVIDHCPYAYVTLAYSNLSAVNAILLANSLQLYNNKVLNLLDDSKKIITRYHIPVVILICDKINNDLRNIIYQVFDKVAIICNQLLYFCLPLLFKCLL